MKWFNKSGKEVEINDTPSNVAAAKQAGWTQEKPKVKKG